MLQVAQRPTNMRSDFETQGTLYCPCSAQSAVPREGEMIDSYQFREYIDAANVTEGGETNQRRNTGQNSCAGYRCIRSGRGTGMERSDTGDIQGRLRRGREHSRHAYLRCYRHPNSGACNYPDSACCKEGKRREIGRGKSGKRALLVKARLAGGAGSVSCCLRFERKAKKLALSWW